MYILCLYKKDRLRGDFGILQRGPKGVISEFGNTFWSQVYVYILSMGRDRVRVENTYLFCRAAHGLSMDRNWHGSRSRSSRARGAIKRYRPASTDLLNHLMNRLLDHIDRIEQLSSTNRLVLTVRVLDLHRFK